MKKTFRDLAKKIKLLILDVDGVLTDGKLLVMENGEVAKSFDIKDGLGIKMLLLNNIEVAIITKNSSQSTKHRMRALGVKYIFCGVEDKIATYTQLKKKLRLKDHEISYVGDDLPDIPVLEKVGLKIAVHDAVPAVLNLADYITQKNAGNSAVREVCEMLLLAQNKQIICP
ncbi:MAG: HAD hydrolase family protein [Gammaproteobacteria bacterium]|nr:HAD hydrolase family protein [Gammaproteobacteria bacterium]